MVIKPTEGRINGEARKANESKRNRQTAEDRTLETGAPSFAMSEIHAGGVTKTPTAFC